MSISQEAVAMFCSWQGLASHEPCIRLCGIPTRSSVATERKTSTRLHSWEKYGTLYPFFIIQTLMNISEPITKNYNQR